MPLTGHEGIIVVMRHEDDTEEGNRPIVDDAKERLAKLRPRLESAIGGPFTRAITSPLRRCCETAKWLCLEDVVPAERGYLAKFAAFPKGVKEMAFDKEIDTSVAFFLKIGNEEGLPMMMNGGGATYVSELVLMVREVSPGQRCLVIGHGGSIDAAASHFYRGKFKMSHIIKKGEGFILRVVKGKLEFACWIKHGRPIQI